MTPLQLVNYAYDTLELSLPIVNGRAWLRGKISYATMERLKGPLTGVLAERYKKLDTPEGIREAKAEDEADGFVMPTYQNLNEGGYTVMKKKRAKTSGATKTTKVKAEPGSGGFRAGSKADRGFALLLKGCTMETLEKAVGAAAPGLINGIKKDPEDWPGGRNVEFTKTTNTRGAVKFKIKKWTDREGKAHKNSGSAPKASKSKSRSKSATA